MYDIQNELVKQILELKKQDTFLIGIDGRGGSGKSTAADLLQKQLPGSLILRLDDINYPISENDRERIKMDILMPLRSNKQGSYQIYDYKNKKLGVWRTINPGMIIIEGVTTLHRDLRSYFDFKLWIECPSEIGFQRGVARELRLTGCDTTKNWLKFMPDEEKYITDQNPKAYADYIMNTA